MTMMEKTTTRALLLRALADLAEVRGQLAALNSQLQRQAEAGAALRTEAADTQVMTEPMPPPKPEPAAFDEPTRAMLAKIAVAPIHELPMMVTKKAQHDDGSPVIGPDGRVVLLNQDGTPLTVIQQAIMRRIEELRG